jgi:hypothetical protein
MQVFEAAEGDGFDVEVRPIIRPLKPSPIDLLAYATGQGVKAFGFGVVVSGLFGSFADSKDTSAWAASITR